MKRTKLSKLLSVALFLCTTTPSFAQPSTLARISFEIPPDRHTAFDKAYEKQIVPILESHGLKPAQQKSRQTPAHIFARLLHIDSSDKVFPIRAALRRSTLWQNTLTVLSDSLSFSKNQHISETFESPIPWRLEVYVAYPNVPKQQIKIQPKPLTGHINTGRWQTYTAKVGMPGGQITYLLQDQQGNIWFATYGTGVSQFDGHTIKTWTEKDGLADESANHILEDHQGNIWFATYGSHESKGVSRFDGTNWKTFTTNDGLADNAVNHIFQDVHNNIWFATDAGVSRFDGTNWQTLTTQDGLPSNQVRNLFQDRQNNIWFINPESISQYDGQSFITHKPTDLSPDNIIRNSFLDQEDKIWLLTSRAILRFDGKHFESIDIPIDLFSNISSLSKITQDDNGHIWVGCLKGAITYDGHTWKIFAKENGVTDQRISAIFQDREKNIWFGTAFGSLIRYEPNTFQSFVSVQNRPIQSVRGILQAQDQTLWFALFGTGILKYDGQQFSIFSQDDILTANNMRPILQEHTGALWFGSTRYTGESYQNFTYKDGLPGRFVYASLEDHYGNIWLSIWGNGVVKYDGQTFETFSTTDGLSNNTVRDIYQDKAGHLWFGTHQGVSRYDGQTFKNFTTEDGLADEWIMAIHQDKDGAFWFGGFKHGVTRYTPQAPNQTQWQTFDTQDGLAHNSVWTIYEDDKNHLWFGTYGGASRYDGQIFQTLTAQDGLSNDRVDAIFQDNKGDYWFGTLNGITRYRQPKPVAPRMSIQALVADRRYEHNISDLSLSMRNSLIAIEYQAQNFKTRSDGMVYRYRLKGHEATWSNTRKTRLEYPDLPSGNYTFEIQAVDRDLTYSDMASLTFTLHPPYERIGWITSLGLAVLLIIYQTGRVIRRDRRLREEAEEELQMAHHLQMGLMPQTHPNIAGFDIAGRCLPATQVGGDFFQYFQKNNKIILSIADVTGHGMEAAIPVVMFSGILKTEMQYDHTPQSLFNNLNRTLCTTLGTRTFVCFMLGELNIENRNLALSNAACPYPFHYRAQTNDVVEIELDAYPLSIHPDTEYDASTITLQIGDRIIFCSDGITEAENENMAPIPSEHLTSIIHQACQNTQTAEQAIDHILSSISSFKKNAPQTDDMTCVVLQVTQ